MRDSFSPLGAKIAHVSVLVLSGSYGSVFANTARSNRPFTIGPSNAKIPLYGYGLIVIPIPTARSIC